MKKFVIELDEDKYNKLKKYVEQSGCSDYFDNAIAKATPLEKEFENINVEIDAMLKSDETKNDKWANVIINKSYLFKRIINKRISELKEG